RRDSQAAGAKRGNLRAVAHELRRAEREEHSSRTQPEEQGGVRSRASGGTGGHDCFEQLTHRKQFGRREGRPTLRRPTTPDQFAAKPVTPAGRSPATPIAVRLPSCCTR